jgi:hypothetical protein
MMLFPSSPYYPITTCSHAKFVCLPNSKCVCLPNLFLTVLMIDSNSITREGMQAILARDYGIEVIALDTEQALLLLKQAFDQGRPVNIVLTAARIIILNGIREMRLNKDEFPELAVLQEK